MHRWLLALLLPALGLAPIGSVRAAVTESNFHLQTARDLVDLCSATEGDPLGTAAINFCHGFALGVYQSLSEQQAAMRNKMFCIAQPTPSRNQALADFVSWAKANPPVMEERPADALVHYLTTRYPCPRG